MSYLDPDVITDEGAIAEAILAGIADQIAGWQPSEGHVETAMAEVMAIVSATVAVLLQDEERDAFSGFAQNILQIARLPEAAATALAQLTMFDALGYTVPDGTQFVMRGSDGSALAFAVVGDVTVPPGSSAAVDVPVVAIDAGPQGNLLTGLALAVDGVPGLAAVELTTISSGGRDVESLEAFVARAADRARRLRAVPVTPDDYAAIALDHPAAARCMAINLLDLGAGSGSGDDEEDAGGHISVFPIDATGQPVAGAAPAEISALLSGDERPLNVTVHVGAPTYTTIAVAIEYRLEPDALEDVVSPAVTAAIEELLSPATWGYDAEAPGLWRAPQITADRAVTAFDVAHAADSVPGVAGVTTCTVNGGASVAMSGWAPLPLAGVISVTVAT